MTPVVRYRIRTTMAVLEIETPEGVPLRHELAGPGARSAAALLDLGIFLIFLLLAFFSTVLLFAVDPAGLPGFLLGLLIGGVLLSFVLFHALTAGLRGGQTLGKSALGIRVVDTGGNPARGWQLLLRSFFLPLETFLTVPVSLGLLVMIVSRQRQRLGDLVAGTLVVHEPRRVSSLEPFARETWDDLEPKRLELTPALAARFDRTDLGFLRELFARRGLDTPAREALFLSAGRTFAGRLGARLPERPRESYDLLRELFLFLRGMRRERARAVQSEPIPSEPGRRSRPR